MKTLIRLTAIVVVTATVVAAKAQIVLGFDELPGNNLNAGSFINPASRVSNNYLNQCGVLFTSGGGYVGVVNLSGSATSQPNGISGSTAGNLVTYGRANPVSATFWMPGNPNVAAGTNFVSLRGDTDPTNGGWQVTLNGYDINGNLVASDTETDIGGETLTITSTTANIHRVVFLGSPGDVGGVAVDDFSFNPVTTVPEPDGRWPMERQDRWGTGRAVAGPDSSTLTTPWISNRLANNYPVSHGASLGPNGVGYFGDWVDNRVYKFDFNTGGILGSFLTTGFTQSVPLIAGNDTIICGTDGTFFGVDTTIMDYRWFLNIGYTGGSAILGPGGDAVFTGSNGHAYRLHPVSGSNVWSVPGVGTPVGSPVFTRDDTKVVVAHDNSVVALNYSDGSTAWTRSFPTMMCSPATAPNGTIIVGSAGGVVYALNPGDGSTLWTWTTLDHVYAPAAFSPDGTVAYVPSYDNRIYALRVADGARLWSFTTSLWCVSGPVVGFDGSIYVHNKAGDLYRISPSGSQVWQVHLNGESRGPMTIGPDGSLYVGYTGNNGSGLAIVRQHAIDLQPDSYSLLKGVLVSGGLAQVLTSDNTYLVVRAGPTLFARDAPVQEVFTTHASYAPEAQIEITTEAHANTPGLQRTLSLWNVSSGAWVDVGSVGETMSDSTFSVTVNNAQAYTDSQGQIKAKISWNTVGGTLMSSWTTSLDSLHFAVVPTFVP